MKAPKRWDDSKNTLKEWTKPPDPEAVAKFKRIVEGKGKKDDRVGDSA